MKQSIALIATIPPRIATYAEQFIYSLLRWNMRYKKQHGLMTVHLNTLYTVF